MFAMQQHANMLSSYAETDSVLFMESLASNHMTSHGEWFMKLRELGKHGVVETRDESMYPIMETKATSKTSYVSSQS